MPAEPDYSILDRPDILTAVFYPRQEWTAAPERASDYLVPVTSSVSISCRYYPAPDGSACILYFHGNGEVACDYDSIAPMYNRLGIGLFVADYRGYGRSGGTPTFAGMAEDASAVLKFVRESGQVSLASNRLFVMGRSLGSHSAVELASRHPEQLNGLIVESGAPIAARMARRFSDSSERMEELANALSARVRAIELPALIIHGDQDSLIPVDAGIALHDELGSKQKRLVIIPGAGHNDILMVGTKQYFSAIEDFVLGA